MTHTDSISGNEQPPRPGPSSSARASSRSSARSVSSTGRWEAAYVATVEGGDSLGGRWVPSEYAREVFDGPGGRTLPEVAAERLARECPAVMRYRVYRTAAVAGAEAKLDVDLARSTPGGKLMKAEVVKAQLANNPSLPRRAQNRDVLGRD